jgi:hypothetical protein
MLQFSFLLLSSCSAYAVVWFALGLGFDHNRNRIGYGSGPQNSAPLHPIHVAILGVLVRARALFRLWRGG